MNRGKRRIGTHNQSCKVPRSRESANENSRKRLKIFSFPLIYLALSGELMASSFISVSLLSPYTPVIEKNVAKIKFNTNILNNKQEKNTLRDPFIAKKIEVENRNVANLFSLLLNPLLRIK